MVPAFRGRRDARVIDVIDLLVMIVRVPTRYRQESARATAAELVELVELVPEGGWGLLGFGGHWRVGRPSGSGQTAILEIFRFDAGWPSVLGLDVSEYPDCCRRRSAARARLSARNEFFLQFSGRRVVDHAHTALEEGGLGAI